MNTRSITTAITAPAFTVFEFLASPDNLPTWATEFCRSIRRDGDRYFAETADGELAVAITGHPESGVVDFRVGAEPSRMGVLPARVLEIPGGGTMVHFLLIQGPGDDDAKLEANLRGLEKEAGHLKRLLEAPARHPE